MHQTPVELQCALRLAEAVVANLLMTAAAAVAIAGLPGRSSPCSTRVYSCSSSPQDGLSVALRQSSHLLRSGGQHARESMLWRLLHMCAPHPAMPSCSPYSFRCIECYNLSVLLCSCVRVCMQA